MHETLEVAYGFTEWFETGLYLFTSIQPDSRWKWPGNPRPPFRSHARAGASPAMRIVVSAIGVAAVVGLSACAWTPEDRLRNEAFLDIYWTAAKQCEAVYTTMHVERIANDGGLSVSASSDSRTQAQPFRECYWKSVVELTEKRRASGLTVPEGFGTHPDIDID